MSGSQTFFGLLLATSVLCACGGSGSGSSYEGQPPALTLQLSPASAVLAPNSSIIVTVFAFSSGTSSLPQVSLGTLPQGITTTTTFPLAVPSTGATFFLQGSPTLPAGNYSVTLNGQAGSATATTSLSVTAQDTLPEFYFYQPTYNEVGLTIGGSTQMQFQTGVDAQANYAINLSVRGLPPGTSASFSQNPITPGGSVTVTLSASPSAPVAQNASLALIGTPTAQIPDGVVDFLLDVSQPPNQIPNNRSDFTAVDSVPYWAAYDPVHQLIFSVNNSWNRIDVLSSTTHAVTSRISIRDPQWVDLSPDDSMAWVSTGSHFIYAINTSTLAVTRYLLPSYNPPNGNYGGYWEGGGVYALSDGTLLLLLYGPRYTNIYYTAIWDPVANTMTTFASPNSTSIGFLTRSGNGSRIYSINGGDGSQSFYYDVPTKTYSATVTTGIPGGGAMDATANLDGSRVAVYDGSNGYMFDGNLKFYGHIPGAGYMGFFIGGMTFGQNGDLYEESGAAGAPILYTVDPNSLQVLNTAPALAVPAGDDSPAVWYPIPVGADTTGMVFGIIASGIGFDDSTYNQNLIPNTPPVLNFFNHMTPESGPVAGGTVSGEFGNGFSLLPGVWYGNNRGVSQMIAPDIMQVISPPAAVPGPVNLKMLFPDGMEVFDPLLFSYGPRIDYSVLSGSSPQGGVPAQIAGYGLVPSSGSPTVNVGGGAAGNVSPPFQVYVGVHAFPPAFVNFTTPAGTPGWADIQITTPDGTSTLPHAMLYAESVTDYPSSDSFTAILYDGNRQQLYLSAGDHVDVFSLNSNQFLSPFNPPALGPAKQFTGLALTPDGSALLVADLLDGSLAVLNPDQPANAYAVAVAPAITSQPSCNLGPLYVAALNDTRAFVVAGGLPAPACGPGSSQIYDVNLAARLSAPANLPSNCSGGATSLRSTADGSSIAIGGASGFAIYNVNQNVCAAPAASSNVVWGAYGADISADGNVATSQFVFADSAANLVGRMGQPDVYYGLFSFPNLSIAPLLQPRLNDAGSLNFMAFPNFLDIVDVQHALLRMRFSLSETISNAASPLAVDSGGRHAYLLTNKGLTIVDLGAALLSIGRVAPSTASAGSQITLRGSGFSQSTTATIGGQSASVTFVDENTLTLTVPAAPSGPADVSLLNPDGVQYTLQSGLTIQ